MHSPTAQQGEQDTSSTGKLLPTPQQGGQEASSWRMRTGSKSPPGRAPWRVEQHRREQPPRETSASHGARNHGDLCQVSLELASLLLGQPRSHMSWASRTLAPLFSTGQAFLHSHGSLLALLSTPQQPKASHSFLSKAGGGGEVRQLSSGRIMAAFLGDRGSKGQDLVFLSYFHDKHGQCHDIPWRNLPVLASGNTLSRHRPTDSRCCKEARLVLENVGQGQTKVSVSKARIVP